MARRIVWTDFLKEEAIYRFWYTLENNNFKNAIKSAQKMGKMSYSIMHNALYSGLYYPENDYEYAYRTIADLREDKDLKKNATLANFMDRDEILMNIHAMNQSARAIRKLAPLGYNAKLFAQEFHLIGKAEAQLLKKVKIKNDLLFNTLPNQDETTPNKPNRYNLSRNFLKQQKNKVTLFKQDTSKERESKFKAALNKYTKAKAAFDSQLYRLKIDNPSHSKLLLQFLDAGLYKSSIPHFGFDVHSLITQNDALQKHINRKELLLHADKLSKGTQVLKKLKDYNKLSKLEDPLLKAGLSARENFIKKERTYPETKIGFLNSFCDMLSKKLEVNPLLKDKVVSKETPDMADSLIDVILKLKRQYQTTKDNQEKKEIDLQMKKIQEALEKSNEHNI